MMLGRRYSYLATVFAFASVWACSEGTPNGPDTPDVGQDAGKDSAPGEREDTGNPLDPDTGSKTYNKQGSIYVNFSPAQGALAATGFISANFYELPASSGAPSACTVTVLGGGCQKRVCPVTGGGTGATSTNVSAGTLQYAVRAISSSVPMSASKEYMLNFDTTPVPYGPGDDVSFQSTGDVAPAFDTSAHVEAQARISSPFPNADNKLELSRIGDTTVNFAGGSGNFAISFLFTAAAQSTFVMCSAPAMAGTISIPAAAFSGLPANTEGMSAASTGSNTSDVIDDWFITATSVTPAALSDGRAYPYSVIVK